MKTKILVVLGMIATAAFSQIQSVSGKGSIDWGNRTVTAVGIGAPNPNMPEVTARPMAIRAARDVALRNALELIKGIQMNSATTVENFMVQSDVIRTSVDGYIRRFEASEPRYMSDKTIEITVTIPLDGGLADAIIPPTVIASAPTAVIPQVPARNVNFTGLIVDARGTGVLPALMPKIVDESGKEVYGPAYVGRDWVVKWGMAGYAKTVEQAAGFKERIGNSPGVVKALKATGPVRCDLVISDKDAMDVRAAARVTRFLADSRVIIVVD